MRFWTTIHLLVFTCAPLFGASVPLILREGHLVVDGVYVSGQGPYRFLLDTGAQSNALDARLAQILNLQAGYRLWVATPAGATVAPALRSVNIRLGAAQSTTQEVVFLPLERVRGFDGIRGILGQEFLSRFDYLLDLRKRKLEFGKQERSGLRVPFELTDGTPALSTSLGRLVLDSGVDQLVLFGVEPDRGGKPFIMQSSCGLLNVGTASGRKLVIGSREISHGPAIAAPHRQNSTAAGLLPTNLFHRVYVCNSEGYVVFE